MIHELSRRELFSRCLQSVKRTVEAAKPNPRSIPRVAIIQGRYCLAYRNLPCSVCRERCPEAEAIVIERGIPRVNADACTGCTVCRDVCPAPQNAVLLLARRTITIEGGKNEKPSQTRPSVPRNAFPA